MDSQCSQGTNVPAIVFLGNEALLYEERLPTAEEASHLPLTEGDPLTHPAFPGAVWGRFPADTPLPKGYQKVNRRSLWRFGPQVFELAAMAWGLADWRAQTRFCGRCGTPMVMAPSGERAMWCPKCHNLQFPILCPAVIVAVERDGKLLMAHNAMMPAGRFSILAGFVEVGETYEQTLAREVMEEVHIEIQDIRYFGSQHWPFPRSMMTGFTARWKSGELSPDNQEITEAHWFSSEDFPPDYPGIESISGRLIRDFLVRHSVKD